MQGQVAQQEPSSPHQEMTTILRDVARSGRQGWPCDLSPTLPPNPLLRQQIRTPPPPITQKLLRADNHVKEQHVPSMLHHPRTAAGMEVARLPSGLGELVGGRGGAFLRKRSSASNSPPLPGEALATAVLVCALVLLDFSAACRAAWVPRSFMMLRWRLLTRSRSRNRKKRKKHCLNCSLFSLGRFFSENLAFLG